MLPRIHKTWEADTNATVQLRCRTSILKLFHSHPHIQVLFGRKKLSGQNISVCHGGNHSAHASNFVHRDRIAAAMINDFGHETANQVRPRPHGRSRFSGAVGSGTSSGLKPFPSSVMRISKRSVVT